MFLVKKNEANKIMYKCIPLQISSVDTILIPAKYFVLMHSLTDSKLNYIYSRLLQKS